MQRLRNQPHETAYGPAESGIIETTTSSPIEIVMKYPVAKETACRFIDQLNGNSMAEH